MTVECDTICVVACTARGPESIGRSLRKGGETGVALSLARKVAVLPIGLFTWFFLNILDIVGQNWEILILNVWI
jgi:hypothetical protein